MLRTATRGIPSASGKPLLTKPELLQLAYSELSKRVDLFDLRHHENHGFEAVSTSLGTRLLDLLDDMLSVLGSSLHHYAAPFDDLYEMPLIENFYRAADRLMAWDDHALKIVDLTRLSRAELRRARRRLTEMLATPDEGEIGRLLSLCASALRRASKAAAGIENAIARHEGFKPTLTFVTEECSSLEVRRAYAGFRKAVLRGGGQPTAETIRSRLLSAGTAIARLNGHDVYRDLRYRDRLELRKFQQRILDWLADDSAGLSAGLDLWQDLTSFADFLAQINQRYELIEHDREIVVTCRDLLTGTATDIAPPQRARLGTLYGRAPEIDALIDAGCWDAPKAWCKPLRDLATRLKVTLTPFLPPQDLSAA